jgi:hypothetical protein
MAQAYERLDALCGSLTCNHICYGNDAIRTELNAPFDPASFQKGGDKAPVSAIREIYTMPMDFQANTWGLSVMKVQTNLPDTAPGQNVVFVM